MLNCIKSYFQSSHFNGLNLGLLSVYGEGDNAGGTLLNRRLFLYFLNPLTPCVSYELGKQLQLKKSLNGA